LSSWLFLAYYCTAGCRLWWVCQNFGVFSLGYLKYNILTESLVNRVIFWDLIRRISIKHTSYNLAMIKPEHLRVARLNAFLVAYFGVDTVKVPDQGIRKTGGIFIFMSLLG